MTEDTALMRKLAETLCEEVAEALDLNVPLAFLDHYIVALKQAARLLEQVEQVEASMTFTEQKAPQP